MDERSTRISDLLHEAAETHHQVFRSELTCRMGLPVGAAAPSSA